MDKNIREVYIYNEYMYHGTNTKFNNYKDHGL